MHWYGKEPQPKRKLGHITIVAPDNATARQRLKTIDPAAADAMEAVSSTLSVSQGTQGTYTVLQGTQGTHTVLQGTPGSNSTCAAKTLLAIHSLPMIQGG